MVLEGEASSGLRLLGSGAAAFRGRFRLYSIATVVTSVVGGIAAFASATGGPNLMLGIGERISIWSFLLWRSHPGHSVGRCPTRRAASPSAVSRAPSTQAPRREKTSPQR